MTDEKLKRQLWSDPQEVLDRGRLAEAIHPPLRDVKHGLRKANESAHWIGDSRGGRFGDVGGRAERRKAAQAIPWMVRRLRDGTFVPRDAAPRIVDDGHDRWIAAPSPSIAWVGHSTFLINTGPWKIVTDPVWSPRIATFPRLVRPGLPIKAVGSESPIVLISHNHRDHLDEPSLSRIRRQTQGRARFMIPLGLGSWFRRKGFKEVTEFDWWESLQLGDGVSITFVPAKHWSLRLPWDRNRSLWGGWWIRYGQSSIYYCGDSAYHPIFSQIAARLGPPEVALLPIGAYKPRELLHNHHMDPIEALEVFRILGARSMIPFHWGTFVLSDEPPDEPPQLLRRTWEEANLPENHLAVLDIGQTVEL